VRNHPRQTEENTREEIAMRKLVESTFVTLDGVIGDPQVWGPPYWDGEHSAYAAKLIEAADVLLLGRKTYEGFAVAWSSRTGEVADRFNELPKLVASRTLTAATWNAEIITGDVAEAVARLKEAPGGDILKYGTGELDRTLLEHGLLDELHFWVFPVLAGGGQHIDGLDSTHLRLLDATTFSSGIVVHVLGPK
jgi:dihydrofolate reductase